jgi:molybdopterin synthase sulfur carrier subunit
MARVTVRYWEAAKTAEKTVSADTLADALDAARGERAGDSRFAAVLARSSFLVDGAPAGRRAADAVVLAEESVIEVLPAFAGG